MLLGSLLWLNRCGATFSTHIITQILFVSLYRLLFFLIALTFFQFTSWLPVSEPVTGVGPFPPGPLHDDRPKAPHVHPAIWSPCIPHGPAGLPRCSYARARLPPHVWPNGSTAGVPHDEDASSARTQTDRGRPQPAQHTTNAAPAPASVTAGT